MDQEVAGTNESTACRPGPRHHCRPRRLRRWRSRRAGPSTPSPTQTIAPSTLSPATTLVSGLPRQVGTDGNVQVFEVTAHQCELVARNAVKVLTRQGLWDQGVRFGITDPFKKQHLVLINPGLSGLTARQILDRMLGGG
jgi:hypothetical protein